MTVKTEYAVWQADLARKPRRSIWSLASSFIRNLRLVKA